MVVNDVYVLVSKISFQYISVQLWCQSGPICAQICYPCPRVSDQLFSLFKCHSNLSTALLKNTCSTVAKIKIQCCPQYLFPTWSWQVLQGNCFWLQLLPLYYGNVLPSTMNFLVLHILDNWHFHGASCSNLCLVLFLFHNIIVIRMERINFDLMFSFDCHGISFDLKLCEVI